MLAPFVLLDDVRDERLLVFSQPSAIIKAESREEVAPALAAIDAAHAEGRYTAGYFAYELGYLLEARLAPLLPHERKIPLLWFGVFGPPEEVADPDTFFREQSLGRAYAGPLVHELSAADYAARFGRVHAFIEAGDIYQANLSFRSRFHFVGDPLSLYTRLRTEARAPHCAYVDDGNQQILSCSPESFFSISSDGRVRAKPMKGTAARGARPVADAAARAHLQSSEKERAENLMIVDLLRNDLGRIAEIGSVAVDELFGIETYPTVHQMVSTVTARRKSGMAPQDIVRALFPCGSVTGAPKIRAMEIIAELEASARGVYCGAIGYFAPDGSASFNVAIRTMTIDGNRGELGIGSAVVFDSFPRTEYEECLLKGRYYEAAREPLALIETLRWSLSEGFSRLRRHLARMAASAEVFGITFRHEAAVEALSQAVAHTEVPSRVRLVLSDRGEFQCRVTSLEAAVDGWRYIPSPHRVLSTDLLLRHKTSQRELYDAELSRVMAVGCEEVLFLNERGEVTEGSRSNLFVEVEGMLATPPLSCGLLNGCLRQELIDTGLCRERTLYPSDLDRHPVFFGNSLRGLLPAIRAQT
ncbi:MAG: aminodeoxychorismate synthase component I [Alphaproteobacteria bacterium]|nr:aminodeoxychorismate synthase component I [Alphaproteobacteria bacterium]